MLVKRDLLDDYGIENDVIHDSMSNGTHKDDVDDVIYRSMSIVSFSIMSSLAVCLVFAANLLDHVENYFPNQHLTDSQKQLFEHGISMAAVGTFIFRGGHNIFFAKFRPRTRYLFALISMIIMMSIIVIAFFIIETQELWVIYIAYFFGGITFGCNEPNLFKSTSYLGEKTQIWIFYGIGSGYNATMVIGLYLLSIGLPLIYIYILVIILSIISIIIYITILKYHDNLLLNRNHIHLNHVQTKHVDGDEELSWNDIKSQIKEWRLWFTILLPFGCIVTFNYFMLNAFGTIPFYVMLSGKVPLINHKIWVDRNLLFSISGILWMFGTLIAYMMLHYCPKIKQCSIKYKWLSLIIIIHLFGGTLSSCLLFIEPLLNILGSVIINFSFGFIYKSIITFIDNKIDLKYRLLSLSLIFMFGDIGATIGVNTWPTIVQTVCDKTTQSYYCDN